MLFCLLNNQSKLIITQNQKCWKLSIAYVKTVPVLNLSVEPSSLVVTLNMRKVAIHNKMKLWPECLVRTLQGISGSTEAIATRGYF